MTGEAARREAGDAAGLGDPMVSTLAFITAALKLWLIWRYPGFLTGDDLEIVAAAAKVAVGLDYSPGAIRSLFHPWGFVLPIVETGVRLGLRHPHWVTFLACVPTVLFSTLSLFLVHRIARHLGLSIPAARAATFLFAFGWLPLTYGATPYPRPISTCLLLGAFLLVQRSDRSGKAEALAGILAAAAFAVRWSEGVFLVPLLVYSAARGPRKGRAALALLGGFAIGVLVFVGVFDAATWGSPFASLRTFVEVGGSDPTFGGARRRAWFWYGTMLLQWAGPILVLLAGVAAPDRRARVPLAFTISLILMLSASPMKQMRYLQICVPFLAIAAGIGWERLRAVRYGRALSWALLLAAVALGLERSVYILRSKSASAVAAAQYIASVHPPLRTVVLEQAWAYADRLYLGNSVEIRDLAPQRPLRIRPVLAAAEGADVLALYEADVSPELLRALASRGFLACAAFRRDGSRPVRVFRRGG
jgi:Alg9-like mannosyltransferase family